MSEETAPSSNQLTQHWHEENDLDKCADIQRGDAERVFALLDRIEHDIADPMRPVERKGLQNFATYIAALEVTIKNWDDSAQRQDSLDSLAITKARINSALEQ